MSEFRDAVSRAEAQAIVICNARRARVLAQPAIAARLTQPPLRYTNAENWNGYVPPATWREQTNNSPQRAALMEILKAVAEAEAKQEEKAPF